MLGKNFFTEEDGGAYVTEMIVIIACIGILLGVGVSILFNAMSTYFGNWATFFSGS